ncbi:hypothetical protein FNJ88_03050 [Chryseobacterium sp. SNU WT5]|uniref:FAD/NAD(P)-binding protein n=1 Tax=Chryseobacterium sp. SNU WT5 TaxID=2594269 RepID=UPI00117E8D21|nr:FAD/NAD(P)-binding protein [Chryseobacterium sp. SNU WT5]QDP84573.1 hypothetical protein FNJ88_03050 [Chryseobacterium sp. SNU WT5]
MNRSTSEKSDLSNIALIGSGPTALYVLKYIWEHIDILKSQIKKITIFERDKVLGMGMPYHPKTTDIFNLANISSEEIPMLQESFGDWLRRQDSDLLKKMNVTDFPIKDSEVYSRVALGHYFEEQFRKLIVALVSKGVEVVEKVKCEVVDVSTDPENKEVTIIDCHQDEYQFSSIIIANGHEWKEEDQPDAGYFASPWPIHKLIPKNEAGYNFPVGTLGASLSAFDVVTSLAHRHGEFSKVDRKLTFKINEGNPDFRLVLHSAEGWLPHLQYEQKEPIREIYRHFTRSMLLDLIDDNGLIRIEQFFDKLCRPALITAFRKDKILDVAMKLEDSNFTFKDLVEVMADKHEYVNSFEGMKKEMVTAKNSVYNNIPIYWMETLDDLMYSLNYHADLLPAEDHLFFHKEIMSFLMNVIAALPLQSAEILLALYEADCIELKPGFVEFPDDAFKNGKTKISVKATDDKTEDLEYKIFVNCGGGTKLELADYPFQSLVKEGVVSVATSKCISQKDCADLLKEEEQDRLIKTANGAEMKLSGIQIDSSYRTVNKKGLANHFLYDINFTHTGGLRPYSYGLQACSATSLIMVESWLAEITDNKEMSAEIETITELYENTEGL